MKQLGVHCATPQQTKTVRMRVKTVQQIKYEMSRFLCNTLYIIMGLARGTKCVQELEI